MFTGKRLVAFIESSDARIKQTERDIDSSCLRLMATLYFKTAPDTPVYPLIYDKGYEDVFTDEGREVVFHGGLCTQDGERDYVMFRQFPGHLCPVDAVYLD